MYSCLNCACILWLYVFHANSAGAAEHLKSIKLHVWVQAVKKATPIFIYSSQCQCNMKTIQRCLGSVDFTHWNMCVLPCVHAWYCMVKSWKASIYIYIWNFYMKHLGQLMYNKLTGRLCVWWIHWSWCMRFCMAWTDEVTKNGIVMHAVMHVYITSYITCLKK